LDVFLAVLVVTFLVFGSRQAGIDQVPPRRPLDTAVYVVLVLAGLALVSRRRAPGALFAIEVSLGLVYLGRGYPYGPLPVPIALAAYGLARRRGTRVTLAATGPAALALVLAYLVGYRPAGLLGGADAVAQAGWVLLPALVGGLVREVRAAAARAEEAAAGRRVEHERLRVAREVHDVVGHGLSVISLQAGVALHVLDRRPEQALPALEAIRATSIAALDELRATLGSGPPEGQVSGGLDRLDAIVDQLRGCGLTVEVQTVGVACALAPDMDLVALRVVQESLTNVLRHSGTATARVQLRYEPGLLGVAVSDDGAGRPADANPVGSGRGLAGLAQRATELGGSLQAGRGEGGGWRVIAALPLQPGAGSVQPR